MALSDISKKIFKDAVKKEVLKELVKRQIEEAERKFEFLKKAEEDGLCPVCFNKDAPGSCSCLIKAESLSKPPVSEAQRKAMHAAANGHSTLGIPKSVGEDFSAADPGGKLPEKKKTKKAEESESSLGKQSSEGVGSASGDAASMSQQMHMSEDSGSPTSVSEAKKIVEKGEDIASDGLAPRYSEDVGESTKGSKSPSSVKEAKKFVEKAEESHSESGSMSDGENSMSVSTSESDGEQEVRVRAKLPIEKGEDFDNNEGKTVRSKIDGKVPAPAGKRNPKTAPNNSVKSKKLDDNDQSGDAKNAVKKSPPSIKHSDSKNLGKSENLKKMGPTGDANMGMSFSEKKSKLNKQAGMQAPKAGVAGAAGAAMGRPGGMRMAEKVGAPPPAMPKTSNTAKPVMPKAPPAMKSELGKARPNIGEVKGDALQGAHEAAKPPKAKMPNVADPVTHMNRQQEFQEFMPRGKWSKSELGNCVRMQ